MRKLIAVLVLAVSLVACSKSSSNAQKPTTTTTITTIKSLAAADIDVTASPYCATWAQIRALGGAQVTGSQQADTVILRDHYSKLLPVVQKLVTEAPASVKADVEYAEKQVAEVAQSGSQEPFMRNGADQVQQRLAKYALDNCTKH